MVALTGPGTSKTLGSAGVSFGSLRGGSMQGVAQERATSRELIDRALVSKRARQKLRTCRRLSASDAAGCNRVVREGFGARPAHRIGTRQISVLTPGLTTVRAHLTSSPRVVETLLCGRKRVEAASTACAEETASGNRGEQVTWSPDYRWRRYPWQSSTI